MPKAPFDSAAPALDIQNVSKNYGAQRAVNEVSFSIRPGEIFGLLGPNGAGKSTLIGMTSGLTRVGSGKIGVFGYDNQEAYTVTRRLTGVMPQEIVIDNFFNLEQNLKMHAGYYGFTDDPAWRRVLVDRLGLEPYLKKRPLQLSGGTKRRHMLAKALIHKPKLLILDEPTAGVDVELRRSIWSFVREVRDMGTTVLLTTHYLEEAEQMCDRIGIISSGKLVALDTTAHLLNRIDDRRLLVRFQEVPEASSVATALLSELGAEKSEGGARWSVPLKSGQSIEKILERVRTLNQPISDVETKKADLEEVFLALTRRSDVQS